MSIQSEITRIQSNITAALSALTEKGVEVPEGATSDSLAELIEAIEAAEDTGDWKLRTGTIAVAAQASQISGITVDPGNKPLPTAYALLFYLETPPDPYASTTTLGWESSIDIGSVTYNRLSMIAASDDSTLQKVSDQSTAGISKTNDGISAYIKAGYYYGATYYFRPGSIYRWIYMGKYGD